MFLKVTETMRNSENELVKFVVQRSHLFMNTIIAANISIIKCANLCNWVECNLPIEELSKVGSDKGVDIYGQFHSISPPMY